MKSDKSDESKLFSDKNITELRTVLAVRISNEVYKNFALFQEESSSFPSLLSIWSKYKSREEVNEFIKIICENNQKNITNLILSYLLTSHSMDSFGVVSKSDFKIEQYEAMEKSFDTKIIYSKLISLFGDSLTSTDFPVFHNNQDERLFSQFIWIYQSQNA